MGKSHDKDNKSRKRRYSQKQVEAGSRGKGSASRQARQAGMPRTLSNNHCLSNHVFILPSAYLAPPQSTHTHISPPQSAASPVCLADPPWHWHLSPDTRLSQNNTNPRQAFVANNRLLPCNQTHTNGLCFHAQHTQTLCLGNKQSHPTQPVGLADSYT